MNPKTTRERISNLESMMQERQRLTDQVVQFTIKTIAKDGMQPLAIAQRMNLPLGKVRNILGLF